MEEKRAWEGALLHVRKLFKNLNGDLFFAMEYKLPMSNERIDLIIFGKNSLGKPVALIFELKGWNRIEEISENIVKANGQIYQHPRIQLLNYIGKLKYCHSSAVNFNIFGVGWLYNSLSENISSRCSEILITRDPGKILNYIKENISGVLEEEVVQSFINGEYIQSTLLLNAIRENFEILRKGAYESLCARGFGPSEEQIKIIEEIINELKSNNKLCYIISGLPGSGKSYVAVLLLLKVFSEIGDNCSNLAILSYRNNRLINTIRKIFFECAPGLDSVIKFYSTGRNNGLAEGDPYYPHFKLVIYDEAQRMTKENIRVAMQRGDITVFFFDENQILNAEEEGWRENFINTAKELDIPYKEIVLKGIYRVQGGALYHQFIEKLLVNPKDIVFPRLTNYELKVFSNIEDFISYLKKKGEKKHKIAIIASFTESPGDRKNKTEKSEKNLRVGYPLYSGFERYKNKNVFIYWLMDEKIQYPNFWLGGESNKLTHCASIYGVQGFEADYIGLIWGRDLVWRETEWTLGDSCEDTIGRPSLRVIFNKAKKGDMDSKKLAMKLLINRYRIFLTRGVLGTYIYCEDDETLGFLKKIIQNNH
ncbi:MAG: DUF2075 domain-containing protein [Synergistetes bacterium]|nr:DUF2075 domain-containing protein [Synergistota bacterium]